MAQSLWQILWDKIKQMLGINKPELTVLPNDVDLMAVLEKKAEGTGLNWKTSVVDFMKLVGIDSSYENRDALATELGLDPELKSGSAEKNEKLRLAIFKKIAENGGNVPKSLLD